MEEFHKVRRLPPYVFEQVNRLKASARAEGADIIDLGMGNPDLPTPKAIVDKLCEVVRDPRTHRYSSSRGFTQAEAALPASSIMRARLSAKRSGSLMTYCSTEDGGLSLRSASFFLSVIALLLLRDASNFRSAS
jgi:alanine-synthesizing transaminase